MELQAVEWLPSGETLMARWRAAAVVDLVLSIDPDLRQYHFNAAWQNGIALAARHDTEENHCVVLGEGKALAVKVSSPLRSMAPVALERLPQEAAMNFSPLAKRCLTEAELRPSELTFLAWTDGEGDAPRWQGLFFHIEGKSNFDLGRALLDVACTGAKAYYLFAKSYHEATLDPPALKAIFAGEPLTEELARKLNPEAEWEEIQKEVAATGYPLAGG